MDLRHIILASLACVLAASPVLAATKPHKGVVASASLPADKIVAKNIAARGGLAAWRHIDTLSMSGQLDAGKVRQDGGDMAVLDRRLAKAKVRAELMRASFAKDDEQVDKTIRLPFVMDLKRPLKSRIEVRFQGDTAVQVYDGEHGWKLRPYLGRHEVEGYTPEEMKIAAQQQALDGPLVDHAAKGTKVELIDEEKVEGHPAYKLRLTLKGGEVRHLWVDQQSFLEVKMEGAPRRLDGRMHTVTTSFRDYRSVNGVKIPFLLETAVEGVRDTEKISIEHVSLNPALDEQLFAKPL